MMARARHRPVIRFAIAVAATWLAGCGSPGAERQTDYGDAWMATAPPEVVAGTSDRSPANDGLAAREPDAAPDRWPALASGADFNTDDYAARIEAAAAPDFATTMADGLSLETALAAVLGRNPEIVSAQDRIHAIETEHGQLDALRRVREQYRAFVEQLDPAVGPRLPGGSGPASFPLPGTEGLRSRLIDLAVRIARQQLHGVLRRLVRDTRTTFARGVYLQRRRQILQEQLGLATTVREVTRARFESGGADLGSVLAIEERVERLDNARDDAARNLNATRADLRRLMAVAASTALGPLQPADLDAPDATAAQRMRGAAHHPSVQMLVLKAERTGTMKELVETMSRPDADLDLSELPTPLRDDARFRLRPASMPPGPWYGLMEAYRAELGHRESALRAARNATLDRIRADATAADEELATAREEKTLQEKTLASLADQAVSTNMEAFRTGKVDIDRVLAALDQKLDAELGGAAARRDIEHAAARLDALLGPFNR